MKQMMKHFLLLTFLLLSIKVAATDRVVIATLSNGSIAVGDVNPTGQVTVTLTVTPATDYYITASDIKVYKTSATADSRRTTATGPSIADQLTINEGGVDAAGKGTYTFTLPDGYGAYVTATFTACTSIEGAVITTEAKVYNGEVQTASNISVTLNENAFYAYTVSTNAGGKDVGNYAVSITGTGHYKGTVTNETAFAITQKEVNISWNEITTFTYDGTPHAPTANVTGLCGSDVCTVNVTGAQTNIGNDYVATASSLSNSNYMLPTTELTTTFNIIEALSVTLKADQAWASWYGTSNYQSPEGMTAYIVTAVTGNEVTVTALNYVPANTPVLLMRSETTDAAIKTGNFYTGAISEVGTNLLQYGQPTVNSDYVLKNNEFVLFAGGTITCTYLRLADNASRSLNIVINDATIIQGVKKDDSTGKKWYTLQGVKMNHQPNTKGIYIHNGKKILR